MLKRIFKSRKPSAPSAPSVLDRYVTTIPNAQNAVDIFRGEWSSVLPEAAGASSAGFSNLFDDARIKWFIDSIGGVSGKDVLELGPLEGGHTWTLEQRGAASILAIEANTHAFLKCLVTKELLEMKRARFVCGDFLEYLRNTDKAFHVCIACGVLYHMLNPAELIDLLSRHCSDRLFVWTHYYDKALVAANKAIAPRFEQAPSPSNYRGFAHTLNRQEYQATLNWGGFCGGVDRASNWLTKEDLFRCIAHFGLEIEAISFDEPNHPNGPALAFSARRMPSHAT